jgi:HSP20 family protein
MKLQIRRTPSDVYTWNPYEDIRRMQEYMDQMFRTSPALESRLNRDVISPLTDVMEEDDRVIVTTDMPGIEKENVELSLKNNSLVISAGRGKEEESEKEGCIRKERTYTRYHREILLPEGVSEEGTSAKLHNGVLTVTLPKLKKEAGKKILVE